jgi:hypothetical protein
MRTLDGLVVEGRAEPIDGHLPRRVREKMRERLAGSPTRQPTP